MFFRSFFFDNTDIFNIKNLYDIKNSLHQLGYRELFQNIVMQNFGGIKKYVAVSLFIFLIYLVSKKKFRVSFFILYFFVFSVAVSSVLIFKDRVFYPFLFTILFLIGFCGDDKRFNLLVFSFVLFVGMFYWYLPVIFITKKDYSTFPLIDSSKRIYVLCYQNYPSLQVRLYEDQIPDLDKFYYMGWMTYCPYQSKVDDEIRGANIFSDMIKGHHYVLIDDFNLPLVMDYLGQKDRFMLTYKTIWEDNGVKLIQFED
jgi:hypothetical protein